MNNSKQMHRAENEIEQREITIKLPKANQQLKEAQNSAKAVMNNDTNNYDMIFYEKKDWYGHVVTCYPNGISPNSPADFVHKVDPTNGSVGAVVYCAHIDSTTDYAWLLAWSAPVGSDIVTPNNQVYVEAGKKEKYDNLDWDAIKKKLDISTTNSYYQDSDTGCTASGEIFQSDNTAVVVARFNIGKA